MRLFLYFIGLMICLSLMAAEMPLGAVLLVLLVLRFAFTQAKRERKEREKKGDWADEVQASLYGGNDDRQESYATDEGYLSIEGHDMDEEDYHLEDSDDSWDEDPFDLYDDSSEHYDWIPEGDTATVAGRDIGGMVYVGSPPASDEYVYHNPCNAFIDPALPVARRARDKEGLHMHYWPGYAEIPGKCRATYLDWLAGGRNDASYNAGYMFLYFYGLERRFFVDKAKEDAEAIVAEVRRLKDLYSESRSASRYLGRFLDVAKLDSMNLDEVEPVFRSQGWDLPIPVSCAIGKRLGQGEPLDADWLLSWFMCHPETWVRTPATRCWEEFVALFRIRFQELYPDGMKIAKPRKSLKVSYRAASGEFSESFTPTEDGKPIPDISKLTKPIRVAQEIADGAMEELDKLSRYLGRNPESRGTLQAHALLPARLWDQFPSKQIEGLRKWAGEIVAGEGLAPLEEVVTRLAGRWTGSAQKRELTNAADALARLGFGMAPDPRFALRSPKPGEPVVIFDLGGPVEKLEEVSATYRGALMKAALGSFVAHADGRFVESEWDEIEARAVATKGLGDQERRRLASNLKWFRAVPPDLALLRRRMKDQDLDGRAAIRAALVSVSHADGVIHPKEVAGIEAIYKTLGLDPAQAHADLHAGEVADGPLTVRRAKAGRPGEAIPKRREAGDALDSGRIEAILSDTERVSEVLGDIFGEETKSPEERASGAEGVLRGLEARHGALAVALVARSHWTVEAFGKLCEKHGLMAAGAFGTINEWAFETHDEALLDEYEGYDVSEAVAEQVRKEAKGKGK